MPWTAPTRRCRRFAQTVVVTGLLATMDYASAVDRTAPRGPARPHKRSESLPCLFACEAVDDDGCEDVSFRLVAAPGAGRRWAGVKLQRSGEALATLAAGLGAWSGSEDLAEASKRFVARVAGREDSERGRSALARPCDVFLEACGSSLKFAEWAEAATVVDGYAEGRGGSRRWDLADSVVDQGGKRERNSQLQRLLSRPVSTRFG